jgi:hypothetical protein
MSLAMAFGRTKSDKNPRDNEKCKNDSVRLNKMKQA